MIKFTHSTKDRCYCACDNCEKEGFHSYFIESNPPKVVGEGYWDEIVCCGFILCDDCAKKFIEEVRNMEVEE